LIEALDSKSRRRREWASDKILSSGMAYGHAFASAPPARRELGVYVGQARAEREAAAELELERAAEVEADRRREQERELQSLADVEPMADLRKVSQVQGVGWPAWVRRPSRGGWR
jgi:hypothetical protein